MHDLSDGFAFVGVRSQPRVLPGGVKTSAVQLRSDDGAAYVELSGGHVCKVLAPGGINLNGVTIDAAGNLTTPATVWGQTDVKFGTKSGIGHTHTGVAPGSSNSGPPA
jgi:hypothetical protein